MKQWITARGTMVWRVGTRRSNAYLIVRGEHCVLIDTGTKRPLGRLVQAFARCHVDALDAIILTHSHYDHAGNVAALKRFFHAPVVIQRQEAAFLASGDSPIPRGSIAPTRLLTSLFSRMVQPLLRYDGVTCEHCIDDRFDLGVFGIEGYLMHTPGHSSGSMSAIIDGEIALVGDAMMGVYPGSIFIPFADDIPEMVRSWQRLLETHCRLFLPAHGNAIPADLVHREIDRQRRRRK